MRQSTPQQVTRHPESTRLQYGLVDRALMLWWERLQQQVIDDDLGKSGAKTEVVEELAKSILSRNASPDVPFSVSLNPYRGCEHGCIYCFARPTHSYLGLSPGLDFESKIFAKMNAPELLQVELSRASYIPQPIALGVNTGAYQPCERTLRLTRRVLEGCMNPNTRLR